ncbi:hypothetical protein [Streptomyces sp. NPDC017520]|uniref:hypothetical protein n=1 Tax=Streptomyces sp. NPDC017520 TaxID=3364998 RepID=UPI00378E4337
MTPSRRRGAARQHALAESRTWLVAFLQQSLGPEVGEVRARDLLQQAEAWESIPVVYALAAHVQSRPQALTSPSPQAPLALLRLLRVLDAAEYGAQITHLGCAVCGRTDVLLRVNSAAGRCCPTCAARGRLKECSRCGRIQRIVTRDAVCRRCYLADTDRWETCAYCGRSRPVHTRRGDGSVLCERCAPRPERACVHCGRVSK